MSKIDINAIKAEVQMAQQTGRKMCSIHIDELMSLVMRADELAKVQGLVPFKIGYCNPDDIHKILRGELFRAGVQLKKGPKYRIEVLVQSLPDGSKNAIDVVAQTKQNTPLQIGD